MQSLPALPAGPFPVPYTKPIAPPQWAVPQPVMPFWYRQVNTRWNRIFPAVMVAHQSWWLGRNVVSRHLTGKDSHAIGGVPSTLQGYLAAMACIPVLKMARGHIFRSHLWNRGPPQPWSWDLWTFEKARFPARVAFWTLQFSFAAGLGALKVVVDKIEVTRRLHNASLLKVRREVQQKEKAEHAAKEAAALEAAKAKKEADKAARKAAKKAEREKAKLSGGKA